MLAQEHTTHGEIDLCKCGNLVYEVDSTKLERKCGLLSVETASLYKET